MSNKQDMPAANILRSTKADRLALLCLLAGIVVFLIFFMMDYNNWFIHPHSSEDQLDLLVPDRLHFGWRDWVQPFVHIADHHDRSRMLAYLVTLADYRLRLLAYDHLVLFPPFSIAWVFTVGITPYLFFRAARNLGMSTESALAALIFYITSTGYLSCFTMVMLSAKPLSNAAFIICLYLMSRLKLKAGSGELFCQIRSPLKIVLSLVMLLSLFLDELPLFLFVFLPLIFPDLFLPPRPGLKPAAKAVVNAACFLAPFGLFLFLIIGIVPLITQHFFGYRFDYVGTVFSSSGQESLLGKFLALKESAGFLMNSFTDNFMNLFGTALVPGQLSPFITHDTAGDVFSGQSRNTTQALILTAVFTGAAFLMARAGHDNKRYFIRFALVSVIYTMFMSVIVGRTIVYVTGYYYGSTFSLFLAFMAGFCFEEAARYGSKAKWLATGLTVLILVIQLNNFLIINRSYIFFHNEVWTRNIYKNTYPMADNKPLTRRELQALWQAWKEKTIVPYVKENPVSTGAVFLLAELRHRDTRYQDLPAS